MSRAADTPVLKLVKDTPPESIRTRHGEYVDDADMCKEHGYRGQGWPTSVKDFDVLDDGVLAVDGCITCLNIWRLVHINPGTDRAGQ